jgi:hypothetical protein
MFSCFIPQHVASHQTTSQFQVPGFSFALYCQKELAKLKGKTPRSLALDLYAQAQGLTTGIGQFRFTPPTQPILAFHQVTSTGKTASVFVFALLICTGRC